MRNYQLFILLLTICFTSCKTTYFYSTLDTEDKNLFKNEQGSFVFENDTLSITYNFKGLDLPISFSIYNKLSFPIALDWRQSAIIIEEEVRDYGIIDNESEDKQFIPPHSNVSLTPTVLSALPFEAYPDSIFSKNSLINNKSKEIKVLEANYDEASSPLLFSNYLTFNIIKGELPLKSFSTEHSFYISKVIKTSKVSPMEMPDYEERQDLFYVQKTKKSGFAKVMEGVGATVIVAGVVAVSTSYYQEEEN